MGKINKELLPMKAHYFLFNAGLVGILSFLPLFARQLGFSGITVGTIYTVLPISGVLGRIFFGAVADRFQIQKSIFLGSMIMMTISFFMTQFIPEVPTSSSVELTCDKLTYFKACKSDIDSCALSDMMADANENTTILCEASCNVSPSLLYDICESWGVNEFCNSKSPASSTLNFEAEISLTHTILLESCIYLRVHKTQFNGLSHIPYCNNLTTANCSMACNSISLNELLETPTADSYNVTQLYQFWLFTVLLVIAFIAKVVATSVGDAICFSLLGKKPQEFGRQRLWGAVGWGGASMLAGFLVDKFSEGKVEKDFSAIFYLMLVLMILDVVISCRLECRQEISRGNFFKNVGRLMLEPRIAVFIMWCTFIGVTTGVLWLFLFWHLEDLVSNDDCKVKLWLKTMEGLLVGVRCFGGELPFFFFAGPILRAIGHIHSMSLVLFVFGLRCTLYSVLQDPLWCFPLELLQGLTFGICYTTMTSYASIIAPPGTEATMQGIVGAIFEGVDAIKPSNYRSPQEAIKSLEENSAL
ncbi:hypothetical protein C0J52_19089 [Blattella germanica]|nr:hypothetical protein C0J52_19089 [Blattella germanica]